MPKHRVKIIIPIIVAIIMVSIFMLTVFTGKEASSIPPWAKPGFVLEYSNGYTYVVKTVSNGKAEIIVINATLNRNVDALKYLINKGNYRIINVDLDRGYLYFTTGMGESSVVSALEEAGLEIESIKLIADIPNNYSRIIDSELGVRKAKVYELKLGGDKMEGSLRVHVDKELHVILYIEGLIYYKETQLSTAYAINLMRYYTVNPDILSASP
ncbi:MAG: hypothetical protein F7C81_04515 [Desulfurococcales archaeon]|nr:hypothetical protein [Desulfurococcales archaeon]